MSKSIFFETKERKLASICRPLNRPIDEKIYRHVSKGDDFCNPYFSSPVFKILYKCRWGGGAGGGEGATFKEKMEHIIWIIPVRRKINIFMSNGVSFMPKNVKYVYYAIDSETVTPTWTKK